jgi:hypothetical protein
MFSVYNDEIFQIKIFGLETYLKYKVLKEVSDTNAVQL